MLDETYQSYSSDIAAVANQLVKERNYWLKKLSGDLEKISFPYDYDYLMAAHDQVDKDMNLDEAAIQFPAELSKKILWISNKSDERLLMILTASLAALLNKYTGNEDIILGMPIYKQESEGKFINTVLPQRNHVQQDMTFKELLYQVKQTIDQSVQNQNYPMKALLYELNLPYSEVDFPLFDIDLLLKNIQDKSYIQHIHPKMRFLFSRREEFLEGTVEYNPTFYSQDTVERIITHFISLLKGALADVSLPLSRLDLLSEAERKNILEDFNNTAKQYLDPQGLPMQETGTLVTLFAGQVAKTPGNTAVIDAARDIKLTYRQLDAASNRLAHLLKKAGVKPGKIAAIALENPLETVTAILAVLKTGGCYLPIDHDYPGARKRYMLLDSEAGVLIGENLEEITKDITSITTVIDITSRGEDIAAQSDEDPGISISPVSPAYIIYTSGTTGQPKGVVLEHRHAVNTLCFRREAYNMTPGDVALQLFSYSFDGFITSFFTPLFSGTPIVLLSKSDIKDLFKIKEAILRYKVTHFISVPTLYRGIIVSLTNEEARSLKVVTLAGEAVTANILEMTRDKNPNLEIANEYGVTEGAVMSTLFRHQEKAEKIKIGKPIANTQLYILNEENRLQPIGLPGELCIAGAGAASGYLNKPELTAEKFCLWQPGGRLFEGTRGLAPLLLEGTDKDHMHSFNHASMQYHSPTTHYPIYRTGDLARWDKDGNIEFLGRADQQVKLRGFRIEPGEIENRLSSHPAVKESHVMVVENAAGDKQLVSYVVPDPKKAFTVRQLLKFQQEGVLEDQEILTMPGNMPVAFVSRKEVELLHEKIFAEQAYLKHGITLEQDACVFDVGAHIGLFSIFVKNNCPSAVIYAFEPLPPIFEVLKLNTSLYGINARLFSFGLAAAQGEESFTFYPNASGFSGRFPDKNKEMALIGSYIMGQQETGAPGHVKKETLSETQINELLEERLTKSKFSCPTKSLSQLIREKDVKHIDLLKITTERSELEILKGIEEQDWPKIHQLVIEVDNGDGRLEHIKNLLQNHGYQVIIDQDEELENTDLYSIYARFPQPKTGGSKIGIKDQDQSPQWHNPQHLQDDIKAFLAGKIPDFMVPQAYVLLDQIPLTPNGKVDRKLLPHPDTLIKTEEYLAPRDNLDKQLMEIWANLLDIEKEVISIDANFFELGGHSLTATILASRIHKAFNVKIPMTEIFKSPKIRSMADYINTAAQESYVSIRPVEEKEYYPLSSAQNRLYILQKMGLEGTAYNVNEMSQLEGETDREILENTFKKLIHQHESLRTSFHMIDGIPAQRVHHPSKIKFNIQCYNPVELTVENIVKNFVEPFDLSRAPLLRVGLIKIEPSKQILMVDMHHIISDGVSHHILIEDFISLYNRKQLLPFRVQYKDYSGWQQSQGVQNNLKQQEKYWLKEFEGEIPVLNMPTDFPRPSIPNLAGNLVDFSLGEKETKALNDIARKQGATLFMVLLSIYTILLSKISNQEDIVVGTAIAARRHTDLEGIIGIFINMLSLRNQPSSEKTFIEFLHQVKEKALKAFENQDYSFEDLVDRVDVQRDISRNPLFDVMFELQNIVTGSGQKPGEKLAGLSLKPYANEQRTSKYDLSMTAVEQGEKLYFLLEYCTQLFKEETMARFIQYFNNILASVLENPAKRIMDIQIISGKEKNQLLYDLNDTRAEYPADKTLSQLFAGRTERTPDAAALIGKTPAAKHCAITYNQLNKKSNQLAHLLQEKGVKPDTVVGIMPDRSIAAIIGIMAIIKAGGAYLPIDSEYPEERKKIIFNDNDEVLFLTQKSCWGKNRETPPDWPLKDIIDIDDENIYTGKTANPEMINKPGNMAYVIYTSGSTGTPKGVIIEHRSVINVITWFAKTFNLNRDTHVLQLFDYTSDPSSEDIFGTLIFGGTLYAGSSDLLIHRELFCKFVDENQINLINFVPNMLKELLCHDHKLDSLRTVLSGGETLPDELKDQIISRGYQLYNDYGPTETTVDSLSALCSEDRVTLGTPIPNMRCYILDKDKNLLPIGTPGELCFSGDGLARGYLNRPELTADRFYRSYRSYTSYIIYQTGDLARWLPEGNVEFLGRIDDQVKIRGFRIELGEIQSALLSYEDIKEAVVLAKKDPGKDPHNPAAENEALYAYIVQNKELTVSILREYLSKKLPDYMIPSYFIQIDQIPLTPVGKVDKMALEAYGKALKIGTQYVAPTNDLEKTIAHIWEQVLELDKVGIYDNFFTLGGNSLKLIRLNNKINEVVDKDVPAVVLFEHLTIHSFVQYLSGNDSENIEEIDRSEVIDKVKQRRGERRKQRRGGI